MDSASLSGVTILPVGQLPKTAQVGATQEDILFATDACNRLVSKQTISIVSLSSVETDFTLSLPKGTTGVTLSTTTGTTPANVVLTVDPTAFQGAKGTTNIPLTITSNGAVNLPPQVRLLINTRDFNQRGQILDVPGKLVDMLADPVRGRLYVLRQDKNLVLVYDMITLQQVAAPLLRTGNTPTQMALSVDIAQKYLMVGNDNSQIASVFDVDALVPASPIIFPRGHYPRSIGVVNTGIFGLARVNQPPTFSPFGPTATLDHVDFVNRVADTPATLSAGPTRAI